MGGSDEEKNADASQESGPKGAGFQSARELVERAFLAGIGAAALTKDRLQELAEDLVKRGQLSREDGKEMVEKLLARSREEAQSFLKKADSSLHGAYKDMGLATRRELEEVEERVRQLELRVESLEKGGSSQSSEINAP